ncbi:MAG: hypothetical protein ACREBU_23280, partial [Nitrososphaera sp.]
YEAVKGYIDFRASHGERISEKSWVLRDEFDIAKASKGIATIPKRLKSSGLKRLVERALFAQGIRKPLEKGKRRHEFQADHGFRKYFKTVAEKHMKSLHVEILMGHSLGLGDNYYRVSEQDLLEEYQKAIPRLSLFSIQTNPSDEKRLKGMEKEMEALKSTMAGLTSKLSELENKTIDEYAKQCGLTVPELVKRIVMNQILLVNGGYPDEAPQYTFSLTLPKDIEESAAFEALTNRFRNKFGLGPL